MKKESTEQTMAGSSGSFSAPMGFVTKKEIYKVHNKKKYNEDEVEEDVEEGEFTEAMTAGKEKKFENVLDKLAEKYGNRDNPIDGIDEEEFMQIKRDAELFK